VPTVLTPGKTYVPDYTDEPTAWNQNAEAVLPDLIQLVMESLIVRDQPELPLALRVLFKRPVWGRSQNEVNRRRPNPTKFPGITVTDRECGF